MKSRSDYRRGGVKPATKFVLTAVCVAAMGSVAFTAQAGMDVTGPPAATDPSHQTDQPSDPTQALTDLLNQKEANEGALELPGGLYAER